MSTDRDDIENLLARYCELFDQGKLDEYAQLFAHGRIVGPDGAVRDGPEAIRTHHEEHTRFYDDGLPHTAHVLSNVEIHIDDDGASASSRCYVTIFQARPDFPLQAIYVGRYVDRFEKREGAWSWLERRALADMVGDASQHAPHLPRS
jgi:3-phenylpropionate/cinnamic acid dioxygenase small subunit